MHSESVPPPSQPINKPKKLEAFLSKLPVFRQIQADRERDKVLEKLGIKDVQHDAQAIGKILNTARSKGEHIDMPDDILKELLPDVFEDGNLIFDDIQLREIKEQFHEINGLDYTRTETLLRIQQILYLRRVHEISLSEESVPELVLLEDKQASETKPVVLQLEELPDNLKQAAKAFGITILRKVNENETLGIIENRLTGNTPSVDEYYRKKAEKDKT